MSSACTPSLVGVTSPVSEILLLSKTVKFPFQSMDYSPWRSKNLIAQNWLKKFMQVRVDVKCMHTNFGGHGSSGFKCIVELTTFEFDLALMSINVVSLCHYALITCIYCDFFQECEASLLCCTPGLHCNYCFIVFSQFAFQNSEFLFYIFEFAAGGMLFYHLVSIMIVIIQLTDLNQKEEGRFSEQRARFYIGEIILALEYLHSLSIIFRYVIL